MSLHVSQLFCILSLCFCQDNRIHLGGGLSGGGEGSSESLLSRERSLRFIIRKNKKEWLLEPLPRDVTCLSPPLYQLGMSYTGEAVSLLDPRPPSPAAQLHAPPGPPTWLHWPIWLLVRAHCTYGTLISVFIYCI